MDDLDDLLEVLAAFEVHVGFPTERRALAGQLLSQGVLVDDVEKIGEHCQRTVEGAGAAARVLVSLLVDPAKRVLRLMELEVVADAQEKRAPKPSYPGEAQFAKPKPGEGEDEARWRHDRLCRMAHARVVADRAPRETVAGELGVTLDELDALIARGRDERQAAVEAAAAPATTPSAAPPDEATLRALYLDQGRKPPAHVLASIRRQQA